MVQDTAVQGRRRTRRWLSPAVGVTVLLFAGAACGSKAASSSGASAPVSDNSVAVQGPAPRTGPTSEQLTDAIAQVKERIPMSFQPNSSQVLAFGDAVCTAFDQGKSAAEVKTLVLQAASQLPAITVSDANASFAVGTAVNLFCPGYAARLAS